MTSKRENALSIWIMKINKYKTRSKYGHNGSISDIFQPKNSQIIVKDPEINRGDAKFCSIIHLQGLYAP